MNKSVYFICQAIGNPTPDIIWLRNGVVVNGKFKISFEFVPGNDDNF